MSAGLVVRILRCGIERQTTPDLINHDALATYAGLKAYFSFAMLLIDCHAMSSLVERVT